MINGIWLLVFGQWSQWTDHTTCSKTCGLFGKKVQKRTCPSWTWGCPCKGPVSRIIPCNAAVCPVAPVCSTGYKKYKPKGSMKYICGNITTANNYQAPSCRLTKKMHPCPCPTGGAWSAWQNTNSGIPCQDTYSANVTCGMCGKVWQKRTCLSKANGCPCTGPTSRLITCPPNPCTTGPKCCDNLPVVKNLDKNGELECGLNVWTAPIMDPLPTCYTTTTTTTTVTTLTPCGSGCSEADLISKWTTNNRPQNLTFTFTTDSNGCQSAGYVCQSLSSNSGYFGVRPQEPPYPDYYPDTDYILVELEAFGTNIVSEVPNPLFCAMTSPTPKWQFDSDYFSRVDIREIYCQEKRPEYVE